MTTTGVVLQLRKNGWQLSERGWGAWRWLESTRLWAWYPQNDDPNPHPLSFYTEQEMAAGVAVQDGFPMPPFWTLRARAHHHAEPQSAAAMERALEPRRPGLLHRALEAARAAWRSRQRKLDARRTVARVRGGLAARLVALVFGQRARLVFGQRARPLCARCHGPLRRVPHDGRQLLACVPCCVEWRDGPEAARIRLGATRPCGCVAPTICRYCGPPIYDGLLRNL